MPAVRRTVAAVCLVVIWCAFGWSGYTSAETYSERFHRQTEERKFQSVLNSAKKISGGKLQFKGRLKCRSAEGRWFIIEVHTMGFGHQNVLIEKADFPGPTYLNDLVEVIVSGFKRIAAQGDQYCQAARSRPMFSAVYDSWSAATKGMLGLRRVSSYKPIRLKGWVGSYHAKKKNISIKTNLAGYKTEMLVMNCEGMKYVTTSMEVEVYVFDLKPGRASFVAWGPPMDERIAKGEAKVAALKEAAKVRTHDEAANPMYPHEPAGFRGLKWGTDIKSIVGMTKMLFLAKFEIPVESPCNWINIVTDSLLKRFDRRGKAYDLVDLYRRESDDAGTENIVYFSYKSRLIAVAYQVKGVRDPSNVLKAVQAKYGKPGAEKRRKDSFANRGCNLKLWKGNVTHLACDTTDGTVFYVSAKALEKIVDELEGRRQKEEKDLRDTF